MEGILETRRDVTIVTLKSWHPNFPLQEVDVHFLELGTLYHVKQCMR